MRDSVFPHPGDSVFDSSRHARSDELFLPLSDRSLSGVLPTVLSLLKRKTPGFEALLEHLPTRAPRRAARVFFLCIDGLGFKELRRSERLSQLWQSYGTWITSVFPSITSTALTSIYQGLPPAEHGLMGHLVWKEFPGAIVDMLKMRVVGARASLADAGVVMTGWQRSPALFDNDSDRLGLQLLPEHIAGSGLSGYVYGRLPIGRYRDIIEGFSKSRRALCDLERGWIGLYSPLIDALAHARGGDTPEVGFALEHVERLLGWLARELDGRGCEDAVLVLASDHGHSEIAERIDLEDGLGEWLAAHARAIGFSGRVMHLYGLRDVDAVAAELRNACQDRVHLLTAEEARPIVDPRGTQDIDCVRESLGDLVAVLGEGLNWQRRRAIRDEPYATQLVSQHGGMSWNEMIVPFLVAPLSVLRQW